MIASTKLDPKPT